MDSTLTSPNPDAMERKCKICDGRAQGSHFGVHSCRSCAAFFRRTLTTGRKFECAASGECRIKGEFICICKKCRFDRCESAGMLPTTMLCYNKRSDPSSPPIPSVLTSHPEILLLHRLMANYKDFTRERMVIEQEFYATCPDAVLASVQQTPPDEESFQVFLAKFVPINSIFDCITEPTMGYLKNSFEEIYSVGEKDKFSILRNFMFLLCWGEGYHRTVKAFKNRPLDRYFMSLTSTLCFAEHDEFFEGTDTLRRSSRLPHRSQEVQEQCRDMLTPILDRIKLTDLEFIATMCIALWSLSTSEKNDPFLVKIADKYRKWVFQELHVLYRDEYKLDNYATRLGELMTYTNALQMSVTFILSELQFFNLFDVFDKDCFTSMISRKEFIKEEPLI